MTTPYLKKLKEEQVARMEGPERATLEKYVQSDKGIFTINWEQLVRDKRKFYDHASEGVSCDFWNDTLFYLNTKGILTYQEKESFHVIVAGRDACPIDEAVIHHHFTRREDAELYNKIEFDSQTRRGRVFQFI